MRRVLTGGRVLTCDAAGRVFDPGVVAIDGWDLAYVGPADGFAPRPGDAVLDVAGHVVLPGLVNTHTHTAMVVFRGVADDIALGEWLPRIWEVERAAALAPDELRWAALLGCAELLRNGVTTTADRYAQMDVQAEQIWASGIRAVITSTLMDAGRAPAKDAALALLDRWGTDPERRVFAALGPHATDTCSPELLAWIRDTAERRQARIFIHAAQSREEVAVARGRGYGGAVHYLQACDFLGPQLVAAHCIYLEDEEIALLADSGARVAHCPVSNAKIEARVAPIDALLARGALVGLGTDAACCNNSMDLFQEMKFACILSKIRTGDPTFLPAERALRMATLDGARVLGLDHLVGSLEVGKRADVIAVGLAGPHLTPGHATEQLLVYAATGHDVRHVFVDGRWLVRDGAFVELDLEEATERVERAGARLGAADRRLWAVGRR